MAGRGGPDAGRNPRCRQSPCISPDRCCSYSRNSGSGRETGLRFGLAGGVESGYIWLPSDIPSVLRRPCPVRLCEDPEP